MRDPVMTISPCDEGGCADGPASFNAELSGRGGRVVSCDPLYRFDAAQIRAVAHYVATVAGR